MSQQVYNVQKESTDMLVKTVSPVEYTINQAEAIEYESQTDAMTAATYFTGVTGFSHIILGPHPRPHK